MHYAQVGSDLIKLMSRQELAEWAAKLNEFEGEDYLGILTLMVHFNLFDEFLEEAPYAEKMYIEFLHKQKSLNKH